ncbi:hypothetical protein [Maridesulfovibrio sp.]|uniref:hypothetical protein n=1 Tax=Maridesulfovibrio sp. TaxID=2795000 RepID=UPI0029CA122E|nr:hypothetical protein [Maridesulfovibrio sp.]
MSGNRKSTPDILGSVLGGNTSGDNKADGQAVKRHDVIPLEINEKPFKLTSYIHSDLNDEADMAVVKLKKKVGKVSKSMLVEESLRICLAEPEGSGLEAALRRRNRK